MYCTKIKYSVFSRRVNKVADCPDTCKMTVLAYRKVFTIIDPTFGATYEFLTCRTHRDSSPGGA